MIHTSGPFPQSCSTVKSSQSVAAVSSGDGSKIVSPPRPTDVTILPANPELKSTLMYTINPPLITAAPAATWFIASSYVILVPQQPKTSDCKCIASSLGISTRNIKIYLCWHAVPPAICTFQYFLEPIRVIAANITDISYRVQCN